MDFLKRHLNLTLTFVWLVVPWFTFYPLAFLDSYIPFFIIFILWYIFLALTVWWVLKQKGSGKSIWWRVGTILCLGVVVIVTLFTMNELEKKEWQLLKEGKKKDGSD